MEENEKLSKQLQATKIAFQKQKSLDMRHDKDLIETSKRVISLEEELAKQSQERAKALRDRETAVTTLVKVKTEFGVRRSEMALETKKKDESVAVLKKR